jgi:cytochrome o ubiquinol oxidase subunit 3
METAELDSKTFFGFWVYLMTDCMLFATLFAIYAVLYTGANGLFSLPFALVETLILLASSFVCGMTVLAARLNNKMLALVLWGATFLLGVAFLAMELTEFTHFVREGNSWQKNGFLSGFFTLVGTHGTHITIGLLWMVVPIFCLS